MIYFLFPIIAGLCDAFFRTKVGEHKLNRVMFILISWQFLIASPVYWAIIANQGMPQIKPVFWLYLALHVPLLIIGQYCNVEALSSEKETSLVVPYAAFTPVFMLGTSPLLGLSSPNFIGALGVVIVVAGVYIHNLPEQKFKNPLEPLLAIKNSRGARYMLASSFLFSFAAGLDLLAAKASSNIAFLAIDHLLVGLASFGIVISKLKTKHRILRSAKLRQLYAVFGLLLLIASLLYMQALTELKTATYVIALRRSGLIFGSFALAYWYLKEKKQWRKRLLGVCTVVAGMLVIILFGSTN